jgi:hypothetical protein
VGNNTMSTAVIAARHFLRRAGWPGILGLAILLGSPIFYATTVMPMQNQIASLKTAQLQLAGYRTNPRGEGLAPTWRCG